MARIRNPRYAPELLEKRLSPSASVALALVPAAQVEQYSTVGDPPPPPPEPGDPVPQPSPPPGGP